MTHVWWAPIGIFIIVCIFYVALGCVVSKRERDDIAHYGGMTDAEVDAMINGAGDDDPMGR